MTIEASIDVVTSRWKTVPRIVEPLFAKRSDAHGGRLGAGRTFTVGLTPRSGRAETITAPDQVRVPTKVRGLFANYYEVWIPDQRGTTFKMDRAYLHLHRQRHRDDDDVQLLSLHCDPALPTSQPAYIYKRGPHLHVGGASPNIDRAHISLCLGDVELGGADVDALTDRFSQAVRMISEEILEFYG